MGSKKDAANGALVSEKPNALIARTVASALASHRTRGEEALRTIERNRAQIADSFFDIAVELGVLRRREIYSALGHATFDEAIPKTGLSRSSAYSLLRLAERYTRNTAVVLGPEKGTALLRFVDALPTPKDAETMAREDARIAGKPISKLSAGEIEQAAREVRPASKARRREGEDNARKLVSGVEKRIARSGGEVALKRVKGVWLAVVTLPVDKVASLRV